MKRFSLLLAIACATLTVSTLAVRDAEAGRWCGRIGCAFQVGYGAHYVDDYASYGLQGTGYNGGISPAGVNLHPVGTRIPSGMFIPGISTNDVGNTAYKSNGYGGYAGYGTKH